MYYKSFKNIFIIVKTISFLRENSVSFKRYQADFGWVQLAKPVLAPGLWCLFNITFKIMLLKDVEEMRPMLLLYCSR